MDDAAWSSEFVRCVGMLLSGDAIEEVDEKGEAIVGDTILVLFNAHSDEVPFTLPPLDPEQRWQRIVDTCSPHTEPHVFEQGSRYPLQGRSIAVFKHTSPKNERRRAVQNARGRSARDGGRVMPRHRRPALVQGRDHLPGARQVVLRREQRRGRRLSRPHRQAGLPREPRHHVPVAPALLPVAAQGRWVRHRGLLQRPPAIRHARRFQRARPRRARSPHQNSHRARRQPHVRSASVVRARAPRAERLPRTQLLRLERRRHEVSGDADHFLRHGKVQLGVRRGGEAVPTGTASSRISRT